MLKRALLATVLLVAGVPMLGASESVPAGLLLVGVGLAVIGLPAYLRRARGRDGVTGDSRTD